MTRTFRAGSGKTVITPPLGTPMGGNARLDNYATAVLQDLYARALWLDDGETTVCIVSLDLLGLWQEDADRLRRAVGERLEIPVEHVMVACTHTHSGPDTMQSLCWSDEKRERDTELLKPFWEALPGRVVKAAARARENARPAVMEVGVTEGGIAHNRRLKMKSGETRMNWELPSPEEVDRELGPVDPRITILTFRDEEEEFLGGIAHFACHPAILAGANTAFSGDWCGMAMAALERETQSPAFLFLNGAEGNVNHIDYLRPERGRGEEEVRRCADSFLMSAGDAFMSSQVRENPTMYVRTQELLVPLRDIPAERLSAAQELLAKFDGRDISMPDGVPPELNARRTLRFAEAAETGRYPGRFATMRDGKVVVPLQVIRIGDLILAAVPGEMFVEFGLRLRSEVSNGMALLVGLANGLVGYVPTPWAFAEGGYEPGLGPSYLPHNAGEEIINHLIRLSRD